MEITRIQPAGLVVSPAFSHVAVVPPGATTIYVGGQNGIDATGSVVSSDAVEQSIPAIDNAATALEAAGASLADVVQWTVLISVDADLRAAYGAIAPRLATRGAPPLVTAARGAGPRGGGGRGGRCVDAPAPSWGWPPSPGCGRPAPGGPQPHRSRRPDRFR